MKQLPFILVTNDDGIYAPGIYALWQSMTAIAEVAVVAPDTEKSAVGHAITISDPIRVTKIKRKNGFSGFAVGGTPADCVKIGVRALLPQIPDLVISGINAGANVGTSVIYSGTVSAATEGTILNIPSVAISLNSVAPRDFTLAQKVAAQVAQLVLSNHIPEGTLLNVNVPDVEESQSRGYQVVPQGNLYYREGFEKREDPRGRTYYWMTGQKVAPRHSENVDSEALQAGFITITPIHYQLTNTAFMETLRTWEWE